MLIRFLRFCTLLLTVWGFGCSLDDLNREKLEEALATAQVVPATDSGPASPVQYADYGPHEAELLLNYFIRPASGARHRVGIARRIIRGESGKFRIVDERSWTDPDISPRGADDGREVLFTGDVFATRRKWGPWKERPFWRGDHHEALAQAYDVIPTVLRMFEPHISRTPGSVETIMQREARWETLGLNTTPVLDSERGRKDAKLASAFFDDKRMADWFQVTHKPEVVTGRVARREDNGEIVRAELTIQGQARVQRELAEFELNASLNLLPYGSGDNFKPPKTLLPAERRRTWKMIEDVLGDSLREIYRSKGTTNRGR